MVAVGIVVRASASCADGPGSILPDPRLSPHYLLMPTWKWVPGMQLGVKCGKGRNWPPYLTITEAQCGKGRNWPPYLTITEAQCGKGRNWPPYLTITEAQCGKGRNWPPYLTMPSAQGGNCRTSYSPMTVLV